MNNTKHTPGPWKLSLGSEYIIDGANGQNVFLIGNDRRAIPSIEDRRLILAAPDLLACLIDAVRALEFAAPIIEAPEKCSYRETIAKSHAAIAKAIGGAE